MVSMNNPQTETTVDSLLVKVYGTRADMGNAAAVHTAQLMRTLLEQKDHIRMIFAAAPSQNEFLAALCREQGIDWGRVTAFHMDEYVGLPDDHQARFVNYLNQHLFDVVSLGTVERMQASGSPEAECVRYSQLIAAAPIDIVCLGIGENGHLAFNDPGIAEFRDPAAMKQVQLDDECRMQQVHDGCFPEFDAVPTTAVTLTIPTLMSADHMVCVVPGTTKRKAIQITLQGPIVEACPASILRTHANCVLFVDSAAYEVQ